MITRSLGALRAPARAVLAAAGVVAAALFSVMGVEAAVPVLAGVIAIMLPLSRLLAPGFLAKQRYLRRHRPLAGPRPGARLG